MSALPVVDPSLALAGRILGALVFGWAVVGKLRHRQEFVGVVANYRLVPVSATGLIAWMLIGAELFVCAGLILPGWQWPAVVSALGLLALFILAIGINLARGRSEIDCGCFQSALRQRLSPALIVRNLALMLLLVPVLAPTDRGSALQLVDGIAAGLVGFVLYQVLAHLQALGTMTGSGSRS